MLSVRLLVENNLLPPLAAEHGLSALFECTDVSGGVVSVLADTGQSDLLLANARRLSIDLSSLDYVFLSHGHYDHSGGLRHLAQLYHGPVFAGPDVERIRFSVSATDFKMKKRNGMPDPDLVSSLHVQTVSGLHKVCPALTLFTLPDVAPPNRRLLNADGSPDTFTDELFAIVSDGSRVALYGGCTHHGVINLLSFVRDSLGISHIDAFVGGLHLMGRSAKEIEETARAVRDFDVTHWMICHCSGSLALSIWQDYHDVISSPSFSI